MKTKDSTFLTAIVCAFSAANASAQTVYPKDMTGLRSFDGGANVILLEFDAVKAIPGGVEDRTVAHFDIGTLPGLLTQPALLEIPVSNLDPEAPDGSFDVYAFAGDGKVSVDEWNSGVLLRTIGGLSGEHQTMSINISRYLQAAISRNDQYVSFNFRAVPGGDRYSLSDIAGLPAPSITIVPLPPAAALFGSALCAGLARRKRP